MEASRLRQKAEELVKDSDLLPPPSPSLTSFDHLAELTGMRGARVDHSLPQTPNSLAPEPCVLPPHLETRISSVDP